MTTDVHQQRLDKPRQDKGRRCISCGVALYEFESARFDSQAGRYDRVDVCIHCCIYGPPRRPEGSPPSSRSTREAAGRVGRA